MTMGCSFGNDHTVPWIQSSLNRRSMYYGALVQCQSESKLESPSPVRDHERDLREPSVRNGIMFDQLLLSLRGSNKQKMGYSSTTERNNLPPPTLAGKSE